MSEESAEEKRIALANNMVSCAEGMIEAHTKDFLLVWSGMDGNFYFSSTNRTWAMGALTRTRIMLEERERTDQGGDCGK